jgi:tetratricopeptide (TPR) repeat protein
LSRIQAKTLHYEAALEAGMKALNLIDLINDNFNKVYMMSHLGNLYDKLGIKEKACFYWQEALNIANSQLHPLRAYLVEQVHRC